MSKFNDAQERLVITAQRIAGNYLLGKYGSAHLMGEPRVELTATTDPISSGIIFNGKITCYAAGVLNQVALNMTVDSNEIEVDSEETVQSKVESAVNAQSEMEPVRASLESFRLTDDGSKYLKVSHADLQGANLGIVGKNEWSTSPNKQELLQGIVKDAKLSDHIEFTGTFVEPVIEKIARGCDQCEMLSINGVPSHETGCPNGRKKKPCFECGFDECDGNCMSEVESSKKKASLNTKKTWLTAELFKEAARPDQDDMDNPDSPAYEAEKDLMDEFVELNNGSFALVQSHEENSMIEVDILDKTENGYKYVTDEPVQVPVSAVKRILDWDEIQALNIQHDAPMIAIEENMPMAKAHDSMAHMAQFEEQSALEAQLKVEHEAANELMSMLQGMGYGTAKTIEVTSSKEGLDIMTAIDDAGAVKAVSIPVTIKAGKVILPKKSLISALISKGLDVKAKLAEQFDLEVLEKLAAIDEKLAYEKNEVISILNEKPATVEKEAAGEKQPFFDSDDSTLTLNKFTIPDHEDLKEGDELSDGIDKWKIVNQNAKQNDKNEGSSSQWTLKKVQAPEDDGKEPKNKIPS